MQIFIDVQGFGGLDLGNLTHLRSYDLCTLYTIFVYE